MRLLLLSLTCGASLSSVAASGQIIEPRKVNGETISCVSSGLTSDLKDCGAQANWYTYVFVGRILHVAPAADNEQKLEVVPEEVFHGNPEASLQMVTSQGRCLPGLNPGEEWLFYVRSRPGTVLTLDYAGRSKMVAAAQDEIATLRRLRDLNDRGLLRGSVVRDGRGEERPVARAQVVATRKGDGASFETITDAGGRYEFGPLTAGRFTLHVSPVRAWQADDSWVDVKAGECWDLTLRHAPKQVIRGRVLHPEGSPVGHAEVVLESATGDWYETSDTRDDGTFAFEGMLLGRYVVGINLPKRKDWVGGAGAGAGVALPPASEFFSNSPNRAGARVLTVHADERIEGIDFVVR